MLVYKMAILNVLLIVSLTSFGYGGDIPTNDVIREEFYANTSGESASWDSARLMMTLFYEGSTIPSAKMFLYDNGILVLQSKFDSPTLSEDSLMFFRYEFIDDRIKLFAIDKRDDINRWLGVEESHKSSGRNRVYQVYRDEEAVEYSFSGEYFYFGGFLFYRIPS